MAASAELPTTLADIVDPRFLWGCRPRERQETYTINYISTRDHSSLRYRLRGATGKTSKE